MPGEWDLVKSGNGQISYHNPNSGVSYTQPKVKFAVVGTKSSIQYSGGEGSPHTYKAMEIAALIAKRK